MEQVIVYTAGDISQPPNLRLLHFNDVYHVDSASAEPVGGIARFQTVCNFYRHDAQFRGQPELLTLFSGDAFNPSLESSVTKGKHMVPVLNNIGTNVACVGNHDLDFGVAQFRQLASQCTFPWLLANVLDPALGNDVPLANAQKTAILTASNGIKIGVLGLVEKEWLATINVLPPDLIFKSASDTAKELIPELRRQGAEMIIAVTHQREPNDNKLAEEVEQGLIDMILGGHDHYYQHTVINGVHVLRSGSDFKQLSYIEARRRRDGGHGWDFQIVQRDIVSQVPPDTDTVKLTEKLTASLRSKLEKPLGYTAAPLDARFTTVRLRESNLGNFVCDIMRYHYQADCCLMASGTIRGDQIYPPGVLRVKDIMNCFPFEDPCVVIRLKGQAILDALENSVSTYPALEGRFPQVSNIEFEFDSRLPPNSRVKWVKVSSRDLDKDGSYTMVTRGYMVRGKDGFDSLRSVSEGGEAEDIVHEENGILISMLLRQYFMSLKIMGQWKLWGKSMHRHWNNVHKDLHERHPIVEPKPKQDQQEHDVAHKAFPLQHRKFSVAVPTAEGDAGFGEEGMVDDGYESSLDESEDRESHPDHVLQHATKRERELYLMRKVLRKWWRLAGIHGHPNCCDSMQDGDFKVDWTKAIAPRLEGRIKMTPGSDEGHAR